MVVVKCCSGCGVVKSLDDFHRDRKRPDGRVYECKECVRARGRRYRAENRDKIAESARRYWEKNRNKILEGKRRYYEENRDKEMERHRRYREENLDWERERKRRYRAENLEYANRQTSRYVNRCQSVTESAATKRGPWSEAEIAILMADDGRTIVAKSLELGRTYKSCQSKREYLRRTGAAN